MPSEAAHSLAEASSEYGSLDHEVLRAMAAMGQRARAAARIVAAAETVHKNDALHKAAQSLRDQSSAILEANAADMTAAQQRDLSKAMLDRLLLDSGRIEAMACGLEDVAALDDPVGAVMAEWTRPNGLRIARVRVPLGVIGIIYESRPNVTADAGGLCLKSGNAAILRGGSESFHSSAIITQCLQSGLVAAGLPGDAVQAIPTRERAAVGLMLSMSDCIDVLVPRGGRSLIERVSRESRIPVLKHLDGICHIYVHERADPEIARKVTVNAKMRRPGICGAAETLLIDRAALSLLPPIIDDLIEAGCSIRGDSEALEVDSRLIPATPEDWDTEYLDAILSVRVVEDLEEAIAHINEHGSQHTDSILTEDDAAAEIFLAAVDSAIVMHNTSTQFADGGEFGMGAEIGISTGRIHARGPVGAEQLTSYKYRVSGQGQIRP